MSRALEAKLVTFVNGVLNTTLQAGDLEARGFLIGHVVGALPADGSTPPGVAGATVIAGGTAEQGLDLIYPNADFTGQGNATSSSGIFLVVPKAAAPMVTTWTVMPPTGDTRTWDPHLAGTTPNTAFNIIMPANGSAAIDGSADAPAGDGSVDGGGDATDGVTHDVSTDEAVELSPHDGGVDGTDASHG